MLPPLAPNPPACVPISNDDRERLDRLGSPWRTPNPCRSCLGTKIIRVWDDQAQDIVEYECDCIQQWLLHRWFQNAGIGSNYQRMGWSDVTQVPSDVVDKIKRYLEHAESNVNAGRGLILWSEGAGTGKTLLMTLLLKGLMAKGFSGYLTHFSELIDASTAGWHSKEDKDWFIRKIRNVNVLAIDEIGKEYKGNTSLAEAILDPVIRWRVANAMPTIIATNYTPDKIRQGYGSFIWSLLGEVSTFIEVKGSDYRKIQGEIRDLELEHDVRRPVVVG